MDSNAYQNELNQLRYTAAGQAELADRLMDAAAERRQRRWASRGMAAVLAAVLLIGTAAAVSGPLWERYFGQLDESRQEVIDTLSQELPAVESNGTVITPLAAFGDQDFYYLMLEIQAPEGVVLPDYEKEEKYYQLMGDSPEERMMLADGEGQRLNCNMDLTWMDRDGREDVLTAVLRLWAGDGLDFADGKDKFLHIPGLWVQDPDKNYTPVLTGSWDFNIGGHTGGSQVRELDVTGVETGCEVDDTYGNVTMTLDSLRISSLGMRWRYHWPEPLEGTLPGAWIAVVMEDGSEVTLANTMGSYKEEACWHEVYGPFETPIDISQAAAVRWGDAVIPLNAA